MHHVIELGILDVVILRIWIDYVWFDGLIGLMLCYRYVYNLGIGSDKGILCHLFLFTIVVEALGALLSKAKESNLIRGFEAGHHGEAITHLEFVDDTILFSSSRWEEIVALKRILSCFQLVSVLKVNLSESVLVGFECKENVMRPLADKLHWRIGSLPFQYHGLPTGANQRSKAIWDPIIEKFEVKLSSWKK